MIVAVDGKKIDEPDDVAGAVADKKPGDKVEIEYYRGDDKRTATVEAGQAPRPARLDAGRSSRRRTTAAARRCRRPRRRLRPLRA